MVFSRIQEGSMLLVLVPLTEVEVGVEAKDEETPSEWRIGSEEEEAMG
jgi:hypothetical protein